MHPDELVLVCREKLSFLEAHYKDPFPSLRFCNSKPEYNLISSVAMRAECRQTNRRNFENMSKAHTKLFFESPLLKKKKAARV